HDTPAPGVEADALRVALLVAVEGGELLPRPDVPDASERLVAARDQDRAVRADGHREHAVAFSPERAVGAIEEGVEVGEVPAAQVLPRLRQGLPRQVGVTRVPQPAGGRGLAGVAEALGPQPLGLGVVEGALGRLALLLLAFGRLVGPVRLAP